MKKLLQIKYLIILLLLTISVNVLAAENKTTKHNTQTNTQIDYQSIDYSKLNYRQLNNMLYTVTVGKTCADFTQAASKLDMTQTQYKKASQLFLACLKQIVPYEKEIINRLKKYSNNEKVYDMYKNIKKDIDDFIRLHQEAMDNAKRSFKKYTLEENY